jgi:hypothetical protein
MKLRQKQEEFAIAVSKLISFADWSEIGVTFGDAYRDPRLHGSIGEQKGYGHKNSCHKLRLAIDLNVIDPKSHVALHDYWDTIGGAKRIEGDFNHYSMEWEGMR